MPSTFTMDDYRQEMHDLIHTTWGDRFASLFVRDWHEHKRALREQLGEQIEIELRMIDSMTSDERKSPSSIDAEQRQRIAGQAGVSAKEVRELIRSYEQMKAIKEGQWPPPGSYPPPI